MHGRDHAPELKACTNGICAIALKACTDRITLTLQAPLSGTFLQRKDVVNQCLEFGSRSVAESVHERDRGIALKVCTDGIAVYSAESVHGRDRGIALKACTDGIMPLS